MKITKLEKEPETELESETEDSFEIQFTASFLTPKSFRFDWNRFSSSKSFKSSASDFGKDENPFQIEDETTIQVRTWPAWFGYSKDPIET